MPYKRPNNYSYRLGVETPVNGMVGSNEYSSFLCSYIFLKGSYIDTLFLAPITPEESSFDRGRLRFLANQEQDFSVQFVTACDMASTTTHSSKLLDYMGENIKNPWFLVAWVTDLSGRGKTILDITFQDRDEALFFKMLFCANN